ncbi:aldose 1-epimerase family protein [Companilactobacillus keshanensis]|uniref:Aldose 1-epimerase family protein n=1 Tax=Companilactobacillus keshanensis TaxID=2486003 RepID=A0ABW4BXF2_9LACO|nr:aldose 1-epimerase family protein [Companilactobacillus keshanensis]
MEIFQLKNDYLTMQVKSTGAEMVSVKNNEESEFIWQADPDIWGRHAPVLFPIVGRLKDDHYFIDDQEYQLNQHGFARDQEFTLESQTDSKLVFLLKTNDELLKKYPYHFELRVVYQLVKNSIQVSYLVKNLETDDIYFSIGAHPGFSVPFEKDTTFEDFRIGISPSELRTSIPLIGSNIDLNKEFKVANQDLELTHDIFAQDAIIYRLNDPAVLTIESEKSEHKLTVDTGNAKFVGIWSPYPKEGNFVCIEPWWGIADKTDTDNQFKTKYGINKLAPDDQFEAYYSISIK